MGSMSIGMKIDRVGSNKASISRTDSSILIIIGISTYKVQINYFSRKKK